jgi:hypothetical protein
MKTKIIWIILTGFLFVACKIECPNCADPHYVEKDRIPALHIGDTILFRSNTNRIDSFLVTDVNRKEHYSDKVFTSEHYYVIYNKLNFDCAKDIPYKCDDYGETIEWDRSSVHWRNFLKDYMAYSPSSDMEINGVVYQNVKKISTDTTNLKPDDVIMVYFSDQQGVLGYELKNGAYFERIK